MTKYAVISFTDVLRREVSRFGVKVISIEPQLVSTGMFAPKTLIARMERSWNVTSEEVKQVYGDTSEEKAHINLAFGTFPLSDPEVIIDDIIDSIVSHKPKANYMTHDIQTKLFYALHTFAPTEVIDWVMELVDKMGPVMSLLN